MSANINPWRRHKAVTPSDTEDLEMPDGIFVSTAGNVAVMDSRDVVLLYNLAAGFHPLSPKRIMATDTTATGIIAGYATD